MAKGMRGWDEPKCGMAPGVSGGRLRLLGLRENTRLGQDRFSKRKVVPSEGGRDAIRNTRGRQVCLGDPAHSGSCRMKPFSFFSLMSQLFALLFPKKQEGCFPGPLALLGTESLQATPVVPVFSVVQTHFFSERKEPQPCPGLCGSRVSFFLRIR